MARRDGAARFMPRSNLVLAILAIFLSCTAVLALFAAPVGATRVIVVGDGVDGSGGGQGARAATRTAAQATARAAATAAAQAPVFTVLDLSEEEIAELQDRGVMVEEDGRVHALLDGSVPLINATPVWLLEHFDTFLNGTGVEVCVIDTGSGPHASLSVVAQQCFCDDETPGDGIGCCPGGGENGTDATDDHGHGTHTAGIVASTHATYTGVAPGVSIVAVKALDSTGDGYYSDITKAVNWCVARNVSVISMSLGDHSEHNTTCTGTLPTAINNAVTAGIPVVVASGNDGHEQGVSYPACAAGSIAVGATDDSDAIASFTNTGPLLDLLAPGVAIISLHKNGGTVSNQGTSMATPHVAGALALLQQYSELELRGRSTPSVLLAVLAATGHNVTDVDNGMSFPRIDVISALRQLDTQEPTLTITPDGGAVNESFTLLLHGSEPLENATADGLPLNGTGNDWNGSFTAQWGPLTIAVTATDLSGNVAERNVTIYANNTAPIIMGDPATNTSIAEPQNITFTVNATDPDPGQDLAFTWAVQGLPVNGTDGGNASSWTFTSDYDAAGEYVITVTASDGYEQSVFTWTLTVNNTDRPPNATPSIAPTEARTTDAINCTYTYADPDGDNESGTVIHWYKDGVLQEALENHTTVLAGNTTKHETWTCGVTPSDGTLPGGEANVTLTIANTPPAITAYDLTLLELQNATLNATVTDADGDNTNVTVNDTRFVNGTWTTNLSESGTYLFRAIATDGESNSTDTFTVTVIDRPDLDGDGVPDDLDNDDDGDGAPDTTDYLTGNSSNLNATGNATGATLYINGVENATPNGTAVVTINISNVTVVSFPFIFNDSSRLATPNITIITGPGSITVRGIPLAGQGATKTVRLTDADASTTSVCVLDAETGSPSADCDDVDETLVPCPGDSGAYTCTEDAGYYVVSGLSHSTVQEQCVDRDNDGYDAVSCGGNDCNDANAAIHPGAMDTCDDSIDQDCSGSDAVCSTSGSGGSGGGGGGGGGGGDGATSTAAPTGTVTHTWFTVKKGDELTFPKDPTLNFTYTASSDRAKVTLTLTPRDLDELPAAPPGMEGVVAYTITADPAGRLVALTRNAYTFLTLVDTGGWRTLAKDTTETAFWAPATLLLTRLQEEAPVTPAQEPTAPTPAEKEARTADVTATTDNGTEDVGDSASAARKTSFLPFLLAGTFVLIAILLAAYGMRRATTKEEREEKGEKKEMWEKEEKGKKESGEAAARKGEKEEKGEEESVEQKRMKGEEEDAPHATPHTQDGKRTKRKDHG